MTILLADIIPGVTNPSMYPLLNTMIDQLASEKTTIESPVITVDQYSGFSVMTDLYDGIHPNDSGERKIAAKWFTALQSILPSPTPPAVTYLSDLNWTTAGNGWGPPEIDRSNGETGASDGHTLDLNGIGYLKGIGTHAASDITYNIAGGGYSTFTSDIGVDDEVGNNGSVIFQVYVDNALVFASPKMTGASATISIPAINVSDASTLRLVVSNAGDGNAYDHADWANALLTNGPIAPPDAPDALTAVYNPNTGQVNLHWNDNATDEIGWRVERKIGATGTYIQIAAFYTADIESYDDGSNLAAGTTYYYRVYANKIGAVSDFSNEAKVTLPVQPGTVYLSNLNYTVITNGWGPPEKDKSNGEAAAGDGHIMTLNGQTYAKGLGVHAASEVDFNLNGQYTQFLSAVGVDDEVGTNGSVDFQIYLDNSSFPIFDSGRMTGLTPTKNITLDLTGKNLLRLIVTNAGDNSSFDHADWAGARLITGPPVLPPPTTYISDTNFTVKANGWGPVERGKSNGESAAGDGHTITLNGVTYLKGLGVHAASDILIALNGNYSQFVSDVGLDDEVGNRGSVDFQVFVDGTKVLDSGKMLNSSPTQFFKWDISGAQQLELIITNAGDSNDFDHADWANARLLS